ncbi:hypothetical protein BGY98DRAFT_1180779 [Russula aff. rugulosa BPL654]|nr:hypothetical protein BGY98DRAFT_1180779 [Russula aff. rugulosa BPL654]
MASSITFALYTPKCSPLCLAVLAETEHLLDRAESTGVILRPNDYRSPLHFALVNSPRFGWKAIEHQEYCGNSGCCLLSSRVEAIKIEIELAMDERQLTSLPTHKAPVLQRCPPRRTKRFWGATCYDLGGAQALRPEEVDGLIAYALEPGSVLYKFGLRKHLQVES